MSDLDPHAARDAAAVRALSEALYGEALGAAEGVLHVVAVAPEGGDLRVLKINPHSPKSDLDFFALNLTRARADGLVVTGAILREEPDLTHHLQGPGADGLLAYRRALFGPEAAPPFVLVLTRGDRLPARHPAYEGPSEVVVFTGREAVPALRRGLPARVQIVGLEAPALSRALAHLRDERGCRGVSVEAGPSVAGGLYQDDVAVDELLLSEFLGPVDPRARGKVLVDRATLERTLVAPHPPRVVEAPRGRWRFSRWRRRPGRPGTPPGSGSRA